MLFPTRIFFYMYGFFGRVVRMKCIFEAAAKICVFKKEHSGVDESSVKDDSDYTPNPPPSDDPNNNSDDEDDNNKNKDKKGDDDKDGKEPNKEKEGPFVDLGYAEYEGNVLDSEIYEYLGIRYAKAPSGDLRWRAPVKPESETKPQKAQEVYSLLTCIQAVTYSV
jgi:hypothetical protein